MKELSESKIHELIKEAKKAREKAYARYSKFDVGAALLMKDGKIYHGANIENAVYRLGLCAEQAALLKAVEDGHRNDDFVAIAVVGDTEEGITPCGGCRQMMIEFNPGLIVVMANLAGDYRVAAANELLPFSFSNDTANLV
ncbi:MAG: cytidine deaminase [Anaerolineales bacterium]